jgi:hypothetical protein
MLLWPSDSYGYSTYYIAYAAKEVKEKERAYIIDNKLPTYLIFII